MPHRHGIGQIEVVLQTPSIFKMPLEGIPGGIWSFLKELIQWGNPNEAQGSARWVPHQLHKTETALSALYIRGIVSGNGEEILKR